MNHKLIKISFFILLMLQFQLSECQETAFELPIQLVGFPFIIASVRLTNFLKKLGYSVKPETYRSRNRRELTHLPDTIPFDIQEVEKHIVAEFGEKVCIYERICSHYAAKAQTQQNHDMDWSELFSQYKRSPDQKKDFYLLSVFMGDIVGSQQLCHQLGKRRSCGNRIVE